MLDPPRSPSEPSATNARSSLPIADAISCMIPRSKVAAKEGPEGKFVAQRVSFWLSRTQLARSEMPWMQFVPLRAAHRTDASVSLRQSGQRTTDTAGGASAPVVSGDPQVRQPDTAARGEQAGLVGVVDAANEVADAIGQRQRRVAEWIGVVGRLARQDMWCGLGRTARRAARVGRALALLRLARAVRPAQVVPRKRLQGTEAASWLELAQKRWPGPGQAWAAAVAADVAAGAAESWWPCLNLSRCPSRAAMAALCAKQH